VFVGSHDSATREALVATIKGKVPYIYTPVYEGSECSFNTYVLADTPEQQIRPSLTWMMKERNAKSFFLIVTTTYGRASAMNMQRIYRRERRYGGRRKYVPSVHPTSSRKS